MNLLYQEIILATNNIYLHRPCEQYPEHIGSLVDHIGRDGDSPGLSLDQARQDMNLHDIGIGTGEPAVEDYFKANIFPNLNSLGSLKCIDKSLMAQHVVPNTGSNLRVSTPVPDMLYGYNRHRAFL